MTLQTALLETDVMITESLRSTCAGTSVSNIAARPPHPIRPRPQMSPSVASGFYPEGKEAKLKNLGGQFGAKRTRRQTCSVRSHDTVLHHVAFHSLRFSEC